jgi:CDP-diacylglycerol--glycerol-3-phosphate 3-phosphatidyltransferase
MTYRYLTVSNFISASRIVIVIPMGYCLLTEFPHHRLWTAGIILIAVTTDFLDGYLARKLHQVTDIGKIIDPLADKIGIGTYAVFLAITGDVPLWFIIFVLLRDILIFLGGLYIHHNKKIVPQSNWPGKISVSCIAVTFILATVRLDALNEVFLYSLWISVVFMILSVLSYAQRLIIGRNIDAIN